MQWTPIWNTDARGSRAAELLAGILSLPGSLEAQTQVNAWGLGAWSQSTSPPGLNDAVTVASERDFALALKGNGTVVGWGTHSAGQLAILSGLAGVIAMAAGGSRSLARKTDGTAVAWGNNCFGEATPLPALHGVIALSAGIALSTALAATLPALVGQVRALRPPPSNAEANSTVQEFWNAQSSVSRKQNNAACGQLRAAANEVDGFVQLGRLTALEAAPLLQSIANLCTPLACNN